MAAASLQHIGRGALRVAKNYTKGYTDTQLKVRDATSNDPWGPSGTQMNEVAQMTYNQGDFVEVMEMMDKRLNDKGKNWRHVFKALTLLDYCLHAGSENVVIYFKDNVYIVKTLKEFVYVDEGGKDVGANVRQKAKDITSLLQDDERLRAERKSRGTMRDRMLGNIESSGLRGDGDYGERGDRPDRGDRYSPPPGEREPPRRQPQRGRDEDNDLQRAIAASMESNQDEARRKTQAEKEEDELARAMRLSEDEEARRKRELEASNTKALFDDNLNLTSNNQYAQQPMMTGFPLVDAGYGQMQPQYTSYNPFHAQMMQQQQQQQQQEEYMRQQMMMAEQQRQQEEYIRQQMMQQQQQQQQLFAQPTGYGTNNPFAPHQAQQPQQPSPQPDQSLFLPVPVISQRQPSPQVPQQPLPPQQTARPAFSAPQKDDGEHTGLANLLARGREDGMDTFGNTGSLRFGANNPFGLPQQQQQPKPAEQPFFSI